MAYKPSIIKATAYNDSVTVHFLTGDILKKLLPRPPSNAPLSPFSLDTALIVNIS